MAVGRSRPACDNVANGNFTADIIADATSQAHDLVNVVQYLLQHKPVPGSAPIGIYTTNKVITKDNADAGLCWTMEDLKANGPR